jgi:predicted phosphodiesterase
MTATSYRMGTISQVSDTNTTFLVLSDTHAFPFEHPANGFGIQCPKVDVVLHCGDLTQAGGIGEYKRTLNMLRAFDAELKLVIAGNHDVSLDPDWCQGPEDEEDCKEAAELMTGRAASDGMSPFFPSL